MFKINLSGQWQVKDTKNNHNMDATVPGCIHTDLLNAALIEDPYFGDNENELQWISDSKWIYTRNFMVSSVVSDCKKIILNCQGLDTFSVIKINGCKVAETDNMFRDYFFNIKPFVTIGCNVVEISFSPVLPYIRKKQKQRYLHCWMNSKGSGYVRKEPCNFGWDWGPKLITCGIWKDIEIIAYDTSRIDDWLIKQIHSRNKVTVEIDAGIEKLSPCSLSLGVEVKYNNKQVAFAQCPVIRKKGNLSVDIENPQLWWPNGMGEQPLYDIKIKLIDAEGNCIDQLTKKIGLRKLELRQKPDKFGFSFEFIANGKPFFAKGANWIPADCFPNRVSTQQYNDLLRSAVDVHMNMIRVWGGGLYENDVFYDICDQLGLCVWQDFMFACSTYPGYDEAFVKSFESEAVDNIKRLRHHPSIALWCGNNELEMGLVQDDWSDTAMSWGDYKNIFDKLLPELILKYDSQRQYWPSSPHTSAGDRSDYNCPGSGDAHLWDVWHGMEPFEWFHRAKHRFISEFGFQSFPEYSTVKCYTEKKDRNISSAVMDHHQRSLSGNARIMGYMLDWFKMPNGFENTLMLSQVLQSLCIKTAVEHFRRLMPRCMGTLYWQLNDCWPVASWSSIDYFGRLKVMHYAAKKFFSPVLISSVEEKDSCVEVWLSCDHDIPTDVKLVWELFLTSGKIVSSGKKVVKTMPGKSFCVQKLDLSKQVKQFGKTNIILSLQVFTGRKLLNANTHIFCKPKYMNLKKPSFKIKTKKIDTDSINAVISTDVPSIWTWLTACSDNAAYSDNFFDIFPGHEKEVAISRLNLPKEEIVARSLLSFFD